MAPTTTMIPVTPEAAQRYALSTGEVQRDIQHMISNVVLEFSSLALSGARNHTLYEQDFYAWTQQTAALLRAGQWYDLDREALAEEVESLGKREARQLEHRLEGLVLHLLKWRYQSDKRRTGHSWEDTMQEQRRRLTRLLAQNPNLRGTVPSILDESYAYVRARASRQTRLPLETFPSTCPWTPEQVLDADFWPDAPQESHHTDMR